LLFIFEEFDFDFEFLEPPLLFLEDDFSFFFYEFLMSTEYLMRASEL
jgi:hypothetical protein